MAPELTVAGDVRWETIDAATARRLGLETRTLGEAGRGTGRVQAQAVKVEDLWVEVPIDDDWRACYRFVVAADGTARSTLVNCRCFPGSPPFAVQARGLAHGRGCTRPPQPND